MDSSEMGSLGLTGLPTRHMTAEKGGLGRRGGERGGGLCELLFRRLSFC